VLRSPLEEQFWKVEGIGRSGHWPRKQGTKVSSNSALENCFLSFPPPLQAFFGIVFGSQVKVDSSTSFAISPKNDRSSAGRSSTFSINSADAMACDARSADQSFGRSGTRRPSPCFTSGFVLLSNGNSSEAEPPASCDLEKVRGWVGGPRLPLLTAQVGRH